MSDLVESLRKCANGIGNTKSAKGDYGIFDDAADEITRLVEENRRLTRERDEARNAALEEAAKIADEMRLKHSTPTGDAYTCGVWDQGVRIAAAIRAALQPVAGKEG